MTTRMCGDIGSFSTAAGPGDSGGDNDGGQRGADKKDATNCGIAGRNPRPHRRLAVGIAEPAPCDDQYDANRVS